MGEMEKSGEFKKGKDVVETAIINNRKTHNFTTVCE